jgi:hypothetical protein
VRVADIHSHPSDLHLKRILPARGQGKNARWEGCATKGIFYKEGRRSGRKERRPGFFDQGDTHGAAVAGGADFEEVAAAVAERLLSEPRGVLTLLTGADKPELEGLLRRITEAHPGLELDVQAGGQPHYPLLLSAE